MAVVRRFVLALVVGLIWSTLLGAQTPVPPTGTITGRVVDATTQQPVADVNVFVDEDKSARVLSILQPLGFEEMTSELVRISGGTCLRTPA